MEEPQIKMTCIRLAMLGDSEVGKTSICHSYTNKEVRNDYLSTIGQDFYEFSMKIRNGKKIKLKIYDTQAKRDIVQFALML